VFGWRVTCFMRAALDVRDNQASGGDGAWRLGGGHRPTTRRRFVADGLFIVTACSG